MGYQPAGEGERADEGVVRLLLADERDGVREVAV